MIGSATALRALPMGLGIPLNSCPRHQLVIASAATPELEEVWLNPSAQSFRASIAESIQYGDVVLCLPQVASDAEIEMLLAAGIGACQGQSAVNGKNRFMVADPQAFPSADVVLQVEEILLRVLDRVDAELPSVYEHLFRPGEPWIARQPMTAKGSTPTVGPPAYLTETCPSLRDLLMAGELEWSEGEPAINVYTENGGFGTHKDHMALTVLIPLTSPSTDFAGGGTGFWSKQDEEQQAEGMPAAGPTAVIAPPRGTALIFGGDISHAGMPVESGLRSVLVASFSTRTSASPEDRVQGLQGAAASASALRERNEAEATRTAIVSGPPWPAVLAYEPLTPSRRESPVTARGTPPSTGKARPKGKQLSSKVRLQKLNDILESGLITAAEYDEKRAQVIQGL